MNLSDWIGFIGVFQILLAYFLNVAGKVTPNDISFKLLNFFGAGMALVASVMINYVPFIILEAAWTGVSLYSLIFRKKIIKKA
ncbi:MAG: CBU_0592 family membrane protein [Cyclobacteriaceae bacterium]